MVWASSYQYDDAVTTATARASSQGREAPLRRPRPSTTIKSVAPVRGHSRTLGHRSVHRANPDSGAEIEPRRVCGVQPDGSRADGSRRLDDVRQLVDRPVGVDEFGALWETVDRPRTNLVPIALVGRVGLRGACWAGRSKKRATRSRTISAWGSDTRRITPRGEALAAGRSPGDYAARLDVSSTCHREQSSSRLTSPLLPPTVALRPLTQRRTRVPALSVPG